MSFVHVILLTVVTILVRLALLTDSTTSSNDSLGSIRITEAQRRQRWLGFSVSNSIIPGTYAYPPLVYWLVSRLPRTWWTRARYAVNYLADTATALCVWAAIRLLAPALQAEVALLAALAFGLNPLLLPLVEHARISSPNARSLGLLLNTVWMAMLVWMLARPDVAPTVALLMVPLAWLTILTSQFGMQSMVGLSTVTAVLAGSVWPLVALVGGVVSGLAMPGLGVQAVLRHKLAHWRWYQVVQRTVANVVSERAQPWRVRTASLLALFRTPVVQGWTLGWQLQRSAWWKLMAGLSTFAVAIVMAASNDLLVSAWHEPVTHALAITCLASLVLFLLTTMPRFVFLGEAERYVEHALGGFAVLSVLLLATAPTLALSWASLAIVLSVGLLAAQLAHRQWPAASAMMQYPELGFGGERAMMKRIVDLGAPVRIATVPVKAAFLLHDLLEHDRLPGSERVEFYFQHVLQEGDRRFQYLIDDTTDGNEYLADDLPRLVERHGIDLIVVDSAWLHDHSNEAPILQTLRRRTSQYTSGRFTVFSLQDLKTPLTTSPSAAPIDLLFPKPKSAREIARERALAAAQSA